MSNIFKDKFKNMAIKHRFDDKMAKREARDAKINQELIDSIDDPDNQKKYRRALRALALRQTSSNLIAFGKWLIRDLLWIILPYIGYGFHQRLLAATLDSTKITSRILWGVQQNLQLFADITAALVLLAGWQIIKGGWYHRPYKRGSLEKEIRKSLETSRQKEADEKNRRLHNAANNRRR